MKRKKIDLIYLRISSQDKLKLSNLAKKNNLCMSEYIRRKVLEKEGLFD